METPAHQHLKRYAMAFLAYRGCRVMAEEVACPLNKWRLDVAAYVDRRPIDADESGATLFDGLGVAGTSAADGRNARSQRTKPFTVVVECKQARSDFLRDSDDAEALLAKRDKLHREQRRLEQEWIRTLEPHLQRRGTALFAELDEWDFESSELSSYRAVAAELDRVCARLHGQTKFSALARYRLADRLYVAAPAGLLRRRDLPGGWGLLEFPSSIVRASDGSNGVLDLARVREAVAAPALAARDDRRAALLRNIAAAATRALFPDPLRRGMEQSAGAVADLAASDAAAAG